MRLDKDWRLNTIKYYNFILENYVRRVDDHSLTIVHSPYHATTYRFPTRPSIWRPWLIWTIGKVATSFSLLKLLLLCQKASCHGSHVKVWIWFIYILLITIYWIGFWSCNYVYICQICRLKCSITVIIPIIVCQIQNYAMQ